MRICFLVLIICLSTSNYAQRPAFNYVRDFKPMLEMTKDKSSPLFYDSLLNRFQKNDSTLTRREMLALLIGYTDNQYYDPFNDMMLEKEIFLLNEKGNYDDAMEKAKDYLDKHPLSLKVLKEMSFIYNQYGILDTARLYMDFVDKIMSAMFYSGKGKYPDNPIFSLALDDGEQFIPNIGMDIVNRKTMTSDEKLFLEVITARTEEGALSNYYFVIDHAKSKMDELDGKNKPAKKIKKTKKGKTSSEEPAEIQN